MKEGQLLRVDENAGFGGYIAWPFLVCLPAQHQ